MVYIGFAKWQCRDDLGVVEVGDTSALSQS